MALYKDYLENERSSLGKSTRINYYNRVHEMVMGFERLYPDFVTDRLLYKDPPHLPNIDAFIAAVKKKTMVKAYLTAYQDMATFLHDYFSSHVHDMDFLPKTAVLSYINSRKEHTRNLFSSNAKDIDVQREKKLKEKSKNQ